MPGRWIALRGCSLLVLTQHPKCHGHPSMKSQIPHGAVREDSQLKKCRKLRTHRKMEDLFVLVLFWHFQFHALPPGSLLCSKDTVNTNSYSKEHSHSLPWIYSFNRYTEHLLSTRYCSRCQENSNGGKKYKNPYLHCMVPCEEERGIIAKICLTLWYRYYYDLFLNMRKPRHREGLSLTKVTQPMAAETKWA